MYLFLAWQIKLGVAPITQNECGFPSLSYNNFFIYSNSKLNRLNPNLKEVERQGTLVPYDGGCSITVITFGCGEGNCETISILNLRGTSRIPKKVGSTPTFRLFQK